MFSRTNLLIFFKPSLIIKNQGKRALWIGFFLLCFLFMGLLASCSNGSIKKATTTFSIADTFLLNYNGYQSIGITLSIDDQKTVNQFNLPKNPVAVAQPGWPDQVSVSLYYGKSLVHQFNGQDPSDLRAYIYLGNSTVDNVVHFAIVGLPHIPGIQANQGYTVHIDKGSTHWVSSDFSMNNLSVGSLMSNTIATGAQRLVFQFNHANSTLIQYFNPGQARLQANANLMTWAQAYAPSLEPLSAKIDNQTVYIRQVRPNSIVIENPTSLSGNQHSLTLTLGYGSGKVILSHDFSSAGTGLGVPQADGQEISLTTGTQTIQIPVSGTLPAGTPSIQLKSLPASTLGENTYPVSITHPSYQNHEITFQISNILSNNDLIDNQGHADFMFHVQIGSWSGNSEAFAFWPEGLWISHLHSTSWEVPAVHLNQITQAGLLDLFSQKSYSVSVQTQKTCSTGLGKCWDMSVAASLPSGLYSFWVNDQQRGHFTKFINYQK